MAWRRHTEEPGLELLWKRVAFATRYGRAGLEEALSMPQGALQSFLEAVGRIVEEENKRPAFSDRERP